MGIAEDEVREVIHLAMTVGASRTLVMAEAELAKTGGLPASAPGPAVVTGQAPAEPVFAAASVVEAAEGG